ncbi:MAG: DMT family transporter [Alphaproteobacteria bacterium]|nr:DMT family transporter [Alphaproteobacteria bacterium]MBT4965118.1 DMT family transporter [Alphaproteobacteria bacterium]MBT5158856.1 DMT family transporter [Alphaproteobacteria bacterium]MBT5917842.1 DMT family transporter [Alphaproteobacteria bacterium]MBT6384614.1 DMT family transporter [Alphaproteobacteria bacterium]
MIARSSDYRRGVVLVVLAGVCWSSMGIGIRFMEVANVWQILFFRSCALMPFLLLIITLRSKGKPLAAIRTAGLAGVIGGMALVMAFSGGIYSIQTTSVANAMLLFAAAPLIAALLGRMILREVVRKATWIAIAVALIGITAMVWEGMSLGYVNGNLAALLSATGFAVFTIALRWRKLEDMMPTVFLGGVFATIVSGLVCASSGYSLDIPVNDIMISLALGVFQVGAGLVLYTMGSKSVPAAELALLSLGEVILGPLWVWLFLGETVGLYTLLGGAILLAAIAGNALSGLRRKPVPIL